MKKGISLIVLIITIIVIIILAGSVILSLSDNNPIEKSKEATFKTNLDAYSSELAMAVSNKYLQNSSFNPSTFNVGTWDGTDAHIVGTVKEYITSITPADGAKFAIQNGNLVYVGTDETEISYTVGMGISNGSLVLPLLGTDVIATENSTVNGLAAAYNNPIIPKGFKALNTSAIWPSDWNEGLVIRDTIGNQFVWVPVDGTNVSYKKWCASQISYTETTDDTLPSGIVSEEDQISAYGGFYIGRYEARFIYNSGNARVAINKSSKSTINNWSSTRSIVYNAYLWNWINYVDAKSYSENMAASYGYDITKVKTGLVTGTQWDTTLEWIKNSGINVADSSTWGNYSNSLSPANVLGYGALQGSGYSEYWKAKNIYDLAGNTDEWTNEIYDSYRVIRGGSDSNNSAAYRNYNTNINNSPTNAKISFRQVLYVM